jgi:hypothetical protein
MNRNTTISLAKTITAICLVILLVVYPITIRAAVYVGMHLTYCIWYLLNQCIINKAVGDGTDRNTKPEQSTYSPLKVMFILAVVGIFYALPGWFAFNNPRPAGNLVLGVSVGLFFMGSMIAARFHFQSGVSLPEVKILPESTRKLAGNFRYYGEIIRYSSFALLSGSPWSWFVVLCIVILEHPYGILRWLKEVRSKN